MDYLKSKLNIGLPEFEPLAVSSSLQDLHGSKYPGSEIYEKPIPIHPVVPD